MTTKGEGSKPKPKLSQKQAIAAIFIFLAVVVFAYWQHSRISCTERTLDFLSDSGASISQGKTIFDLGYKICMTRKGF